jgi:hypothetical protein
MIPRPENTESLEEVKEIVVTRLTPYVQDILEQHGCRIEKRELETLHITFPANTHRQLLFPPTMIERSRILFSDGLELRHERDQARAMSLLAVVAQGGNASEVQK